MRIKPSKQDKKLFALATIENASVMLKTVYAQVRSGSLKLRDVVSDKDLAKCYIHAHVGALLRAMLGSDFESWEDAGWLLVRPFSASVENFTERTIAISLGALAVAKDEVRSGKAKIKKLNGLCHLHIRLVPVLQQAFGKPFHYWLDMAPSRWRPRGDNDWRGLNALDWYNWLYCRD